MNIHNRKSSKTNKTSKTSFKKPWKKVLWEHQDYPDNYTDPKMFLRDLKKNVHFEEVTFKQAALGASFLLQEFSTVVLFVNIYIYMVNKWIEPSFILNLTSGSTTFGFVIYLFCLKTGVKEKLRHDIRTVLIFIVFGQLFSPVLHTLTDTISTDTIYNMTFFMLLVHLIFFDYGVSAAIVSNSLSLSAAIFASICLASRLSSANEAFILMTIATEAFVLFPLFRKEVNNYSVLISVILLSVDVVLLYKVSYIGIILYLNGVVLINLLCPFLYVRYQKYKDNIYGPWDEAVVDDADNLMFL